MIGFLKRLITPKKYGVEVDISGRIVYCDPQSLAEAWLELGGEPETRARAFYHRASKTLYCTWSDESGAGHELKHLAGWKHSQAGAWYNAPDGS